jgi:hypothetical protein
MKKFLFTLTLCAIHTVLIGADTSATLTKKVASLEKVRHSTFANIEIFAQEATLLLAQTRKLQEKQNLGSFDQQSLDECRHLLSGCQILTMTAQILHPQLEFIKEVEEKQTAQLKTCSTGSEPLTRAKVLTEK